MLVFFVTNSFAQFGTRGQKVLGTTLSFNTGKVFNDLNPDRKPYGYNVGGSFTFGKFTKDNFLKTGSIYYGHSYSRDQLPNNVGRYFSNSINLTYGLTKYKKLANKLFFGIGGNAFSGFNFSNFNYTSNLEKGETKSFGIGLYIAPILAYQLTERFVVNLSTSNQFLSVAYGIGTTKSFFPNQPTRKQTTQSFYLDAGLLGADLRNLTVGFNYLLKNKTIKK